MLGMHTRVCPPLKWHGGKWYLAPKLVAMMPPHVHYVEPFAGGLSVLLAKEPDGVSEVVNDLDSDLSNFWEVIGDPVPFDQFRRRVEAIPFSERAWQAAGRPAPEAVSRAVAFFVRCRQSLAGRMREFAPLTRRRTRRGMNEQAAAWQTAVNGLPAVHARLWQVVVLNHDAIDVIKQQDGPATLHYLDPPYTAPERAVPDVYRHEMTAAQHERLLDTVKQCEGKVMLSGYASPLYDHTLRDWNRREFRVPNQASGGKAKRTMTEVVWYNF